MIKKMFFVATATMLLMVSCDKNNDEPKQKGGQGDILITTTVKNPDGQSGSSYIQLVEELSGSIDNSEALPIGFGTIPFVSDNDIYIFPTFGTTSSNAVQKYTRNNRGLTEAGTLTLPAGSLPFNITVINAQKAYIPSYTFGNVMIINPKTMAKTGEINLSSYAHGDNSPEPSMGYVRGDYYYLPLNQAGSDFMPYADYLQTDVAVIDIKTDNVVKIISEKETGLSFPARPHLKEMVFTNEQNDLYIGCVGYFGFNPMNKKNGFVCIPNGQTEFDTSKSWDISETDIKGTEHQAKTEKGKDTIVSYRSAAILNTKYIGSGKVAAFAFVQELLDPKSPYTSRAAMAVLIDLNKKTIKQIKGVPLTDGHSVFVDKIEGQIIFGAYGKDKAGFFTYNAGNEEVSQILKTEGNPNYIHKFK